jgi:hypothetical protein
MLQFKKRGIMEKISGGILDFAQIFKGELATETIILLILS